MATAHSPSSTSTIGPAAVADDVEERVDLGRERLGVRDRQLGDVALEGRREAADQRGGASMSAPA